MHLRQDRAAEAVLSLPEIDQDELRVAGVRAEPIALARATDEPRDLGIQRDPMHLVHGDPALAEVGGLG